MAPKNGELTLQTDALDLLGSGTQKNRMDGITNLKQIFSRSSRPLKLKELKDIAYHGMFESVFKVAAIEKQAYMSAKNVPAKTKAESNLSSCADVLRTMIRVGTKQLKAKTVKATIGHVTQLLPTATGEYCAGLSKTYLKVLVAILENEVHVEYLALDDWFTATDFCLGGLQIYFAHTNEESVDLFAESSGIGQGTVSSTRSKRSSQAVSSKGTTSTITRRNAEDLMECLLSLTSGTNSPILERVDELADCVMRFLRPAGSVSQIHRVAFSVLNNVILASVTDRISLCQSIATQMLPIMGRLWSLRASSLDEMLNSVRDQMLIALLSLSSHLEFLSSQNKPDLQRDAQDLETILKNEYVRRTDRDQLQLDDLDLCNVAIDDSTSKVARVGALPLVHQEPRAERSWAILQVLSMLNGLLHTEQMTPNSTAEEDEDNEGKHPRKRRRVARRLDGQISGIRSNDPGERLVALQSMLFILSDSQISPEDLADALGHIVLCLGDKRGNIASWTILVISACAQQTRAKELSPAVDWPQLWRTVARLVTSSSSCSAACYMLHVLMANELVFYREVSEAVDAMLTVTEISGPAMLCDSAVSLMAHMIYLRDTEVPGGSSAIAHQVVRWICSKWNPGIQNLRTVSESCPIDIARLLRVCLGLPAWQVSRKGTSPCGPIGQAWVEHLQQKKTLEYLLMTQSKAVMLKKCQHCPSSIGLYEGNTTTELASSPSSTMRLILELFLPKVEGLVQQWEDAAQKQPLQMSSDTIRSAIHSCITGCLIHSLFLDTSIRHLEDLATAVKRLTGLTMDTIGAGEELERLAEALLLAIQPYIPECNFGALSQFAKQYSILLEFTTVISAKLRQRHQNNRHSDAMGIDPLELDDLFDTQDSDRSKGTKGELTRSDLGMSMSSAAFFATTNARLALVTTFSDATEYKSELPSSFVDYIVNLEDNDLLLCQQILHDALSSDLVIDPSKIASLIMRIGEIVGPVENAYRENALTLVINVLTVLSSYWAITEHTEVQEPFVQLYEWLITKVVPVRRPSRRVLASLADLLFCLLAINPKFGEECKKPMKSARTALFDIIAQGTISMQFDAGKRLPSIFGNFVLQLHNKILLDVLESLPSDTDFIEGIAFRLYVLGKLASTWPTLLRPCVYYILEVPGRVPDAVEHAHFCLKEVTVALGLKDTQELFHLFSSQLLFTWLEEESFQRLPFQIFGYSTLRELIEDAQAEVTALLMMRNQDNKIRDVAQLLETSIEELTRKSFTKLIAYSVAHDISVPHSSDGQKYISGEARIRKLLGKDVFLELIGLHFADILSLFFNHIDQEDSIERSFGKSPDLVYAANILKEMKSISDSVVSLPPNQQPTFKAKYLPDEIEHLCKRTQYEVPNLYTPTIVTYIARSLLDTINPALGSLHACSVLRKLRVLIALSGKGSLHGYPLEMLLQAARSYMTDSECADDAMGIAQYLIIHGSDYLVTVPSFLASIIVSIFASVRIFLETKQSSTTLDSQYQSTLSKAQKFHAWLGKHINSLEIKGLSKPSARALSGLFDSVYGVTATGNAEVGTSESTFLCQLMDDEGTGHEGISRRLLNKPSRDLIFSLLFGNFEGPSTFRKDILGVDEVAIKFAPSLWKFCQVTDVPVQFLVWAAKVLGRAFAATGHIETQLVQESDLTRIMEGSKASEEPGTSQSMLLKLLRDITLSPLPAKASIGESVIRMIVTKFDEAGQDAGIATCVAMLSEPLVIATTWHPYQAPPRDLCLLQIQAPQDPYSPEAITRPSWLQALSIALTQSASSDCTLGPLSRILQDDRNFAEDAFPLVLHLVLTLHAEKQSVSKKPLSKAIRAWLDVHNTEAQSNQKIIINALLYLRTQKMPREKTLADRIHWLDLDYTQVAEAAVRCDMFKTALLFLELSLSEGSRSSSRRSSTVRNVEPTEVMLAIFKNVDDPDMFYGLHQDPSLDNVLNRLEYERDGSKSLTFRSAKFDSHLRRRDLSSHADAQALVETLGTLQFDGLSHSLLQIQQSSGKKTGNNPSTFQAARKLEQWDLPVHTITHDEAAVVYRAFQIVNNSNDRASIQRAVNGGLQSAITNLIKSRAGANSVRSSLQTLAVITEMDEVLSGFGSEQFEETLQRFEKRAGWMKTGRFEDVSHITSCRETTLSSLSHRARLCEIINVSATDARLIEVQTTLLSCSLSRTHGALQDSLTAATYLSGLVEPCHSLGLNIDAAVQLEAANALWEQGEMSSSIGILQAIDKNLVLKNQTLPVGRSGLLAKIGYQVSVARLEKPDRIIENYLMPALKELNGKTAGNEAGHVFHEFAVFCDGQLQNPDNIEDLERLKKLKEMKDSEVSELQKLIDLAKDPQKKDNLNRTLRKAKTWLALDSSEYERQYKTRNNFVRQSLENYLLSLSASDEHNNDSLRFLALWLEHSDEDIANKAVGKHLEGTPSRKFASLMNQLASRLLESGTHFQKLLLSLVTRVCVEHPYHGMPQIWSSSKHKGNANDEMARLRFQAASKLAKTLSHSPESSAIWTAISSTSRLYCQLAAEQPEQKQKFKQNDKLPLRDSPAGSHLNATFSKYPTPPPTMHIPIAANLDYSGVPKMHRIEPLISIASGMSAPKIITVVATNGGKFKQLVKGGNDDLRQDAIMEQVFAQVDELLRANTATRQRNLGIRTYKVLPLTSTAGVIEFVSNTVPFHDFLMPAHVTYNPNDMKSHDARNAINSVQNSKLDVRIKTFRGVCEKFRPVMRYFFLERFHDPEVWFERRLAYTRSTAAISMLGHILGLGDRHGHNILLDDRTGEVVHIDLGVAFEMGRVLPVPELVPFRLTRDIEDGMGITKTEGVYRRCCEFTLEALRKESYSIIAILDVLRFDPLYSWSISPVRLAKLQDAQSAAPASALGPGEGVARKETVNEPSEADRALTVVKKKLSKTLSVTATVNDLINQATDERNLAVLYSGWAAYA